MYEPYDFYTFSQIWQRFIPRILNLVNYTVNSFFDRGYPFVPKMFLSLCIISFVFFILRRTLNRVL